MSSENRSETFHSADEDISHGLVVIRNPISRQSTVASGSNFNQNYSMKKKFPSNLSIGESSTNSSHAVTEKAHTLERVKPQSLKTRKCSRMYSYTNFRKEAEFSENFRSRDSSDSHSLSSTSFVSAVSSQEDLTLVNLHMQVNKPIVDSPLLMSSYVSHLTQVLEVICFTYSPLIYWLPL